MVHAVAGIVLGVVFVVAGASKLALGRRWVAQAAGLGVARPVALAVPWWELAVGALLVVRIAPSIVAGLACATLAAFSALLVLHLRRGDRPPCACFGTWSSGPIRWVDVVRNVVLLAVGLLAISW